jgi:hypothetical protein
VEQAGTHSMKTAAPCDSELQTPLSYSGIKD